MVPSIQESIQSIHTSLSFLDSLPFIGRSAIANAVLASHVEWEGNLLREALPEEIALFRVDDGLTSNNDVDDGSAHSPTGPTQAEQDAATINRLRKSIAGTSSGSNNNNNIGAASAVRNAWPLSKRQGPQRAGGPGTATPLKRRWNRDNKQQPDVDTDADDPGPYLLAARRLLQHYPMQRAQEHVELLYSQYEGLMDAIADLEEALQTQKATDNAKASPAGDDKQAHHKAQDEELAQLEASIHREELEILAIKELKAEREKEARDLDSQLRSKRGPTASGTGLRQAFKSGTQTSSASSRAAGTTRQPLASGSTRQMTATGSAAGGRTKPLPAVVARKLAAAEASTTTTKSLDTDPGDGRKEEPRHPSLSPANPATSSETAPAVDNDRQGRASEEGDEDDADKTVLARTDVVEAMPAEKQYTEGQQDASTVASAVAQPANPEYKPVVSEERLQAIKSLIIQSLPIDRKPVDADLPTLLMTLSGLASPSNGTPASPAPSSISSLSIGGATLPAAAGHTHRAGSSAAAAAPDPPHVQLEYELLHAFLSLILSLPILSDTTSTSNDVSELASTAGLLQLVMRDSALGGPGAPREAMLPMNNVKRYLGDRSRKRGWAEDLGTKALYGLVAKRVLKIDRRDREALVCFTSSS